MRKRCLTFVLVLAIIHVCLGFICCGTLPNSRYNDLPMCATALRAARGRTQLTRSDLAWQYFNGAAAPGHSSAARGVAFGAGESLYSSLKERLHSNPFVCVSVVSTPRTRLSPKDQYVLTTMYQLLPLVLKEPDVGVIIVNTASMTEHPAVQILNHSVPTVSLSPAPTVLQRYVESPNTLPGGVRLWGAISSQKTVNAQLAAGLHQDNAQSLVVDSQGHTTDRQTRSASENGADRKQFAAAVRKETADYAAALAACLDYKPRYVLVIEDDALPRPELFTDLRHHLGSLGQMYLKLSTPRSHDVMPNWAYLKLYYPEKWSGFELHQVTLLSLVSCVLGGISLALFRAAFKAISRMHEHQLGQILESHRSRFLCRSISGIYEPCGMVNAFTRLRRTGALIYCDGNCNWFLRFARTFSDRAMLVRAAQFTIIWLSILFALGKPNLDELRFVHSQLRRLVPADPCCTPAVVYPYKSAMLLRNHIVGNVSSARPETDLYIDDFFRNILKIQSFLAMPYLVEHVGFVSSLPKEDT